MTPHTEDIPTGQAPAIEPVVFDETYIDHPFIPSRVPADVKAFLAAFAKAQSKYTPVTRDKMVTIKPRDKAEYSFWYAELANVIEATNALHDEGISVSQPLHEDRQGITWLYTILTHAEGSGRVTRIKLGGAEELKTFGGLITYLRRYCLAPAVGVASEDDADNNGEDAGDGESMRRNGPQSNPMVSERRPAAKQPVRRSAAAPAPAEAAHNGEQQAQQAERVVKPTSGALKNLMAKIDALGLPPEELTAMFAELDVPEVPDNWSLANWTKIKAEVDARMKR